MKRVFCPEGPPTLNAGIAGRFNLGKARPVADKIAALLLARPEFREAGQNIPDDDSQDIKALEAEAVAADKQDVREAKAAEKSTVKKEEVPANG